MKNRPKTVKSIKSIKTRQVLKLNILLKKFKLRKIYLTPPYFDAQNMKFSIKHFFSKCD